VLFQSRILLRLRRSNAHGLHISFVIMNVLFGLKSYGGEAKGLVDLRGWLPIPVYHVL